MIEFVICNSIKRIRDYVEINGTIQSPNPYMNGQNVIMVTDSSNALGIHIGTKIKFS